MYLWVYTILHTTRFYFIVCFLVPTILCCLPFINWSYGPAGLWWWVYTSACVHAFVSLACIPQLDQIIWIKEWHSNSIHDWGDTAACCVSTIWCCMLGLWFNSIPLQVLHSIVSHVSVAIGNSHHCRLPNQTQGECLVYCVGIQMILAYSSSTDQEVSRNL